MSDPFTAVATAGAAKVAGGLVGDQISKVLKKALHRILVTRAVTKKAKTRGISIRVRDLYPWLGSAAVRARFEADTAEAHRSSVADLDAMLTTVGSTSVNPGETVLKLIREEALRRLPSGDAQVESLRRTEAAIKASEERLVLAYDGNATAFANAILKLHPWRRSQAEILGEEWRPLRRLVITLATSNDRASLLSQWVDTPPEKLRDAPPEVWCWLGLIAADHGATDPAVSFIEGGIVRGAPGSYWWARAGLAIGSEGKRAETAREYWNRAEHPIASAALALDGGRFEEAEHLLSEWQPEDANETVIKAALQIAAASGLKAFDRAISIGLETIQEHPEASGIALSTAEALISRGHFGVSDHPFEDFARAYELATLARDSRRAWNGDSVAAILVAIKAKALATDLDVAWELTQASPDGDALAEESRDPRLRREAALLAANIGRVEVARQLVKDIDDEFVVRTVDGWVAHAQEDFATAEAAWLDAWNLAPDDQARAQTASALAPLGRSLPDLSTIAHGYSEAMKRVQAIHRVMSADGDRLSLLRAHAADFQELTVLLADQLVAEGDHSGAGAILERGGRQWSHPLLTKMAAARYINAGEYEKAAQAAQAALDLGGKHWGGRLESLMILFDALEAQGQSERTLAIAREMTAIAPNNLGVRWALVYCHVRRGDSAAAWGALSHDGTLATPRDADEARTWIGLAAMFDDSPQFVQRSLEMMNNWTHDPAVSGVFLAQIYGGLNRHHAQVAEADIKALHQATNEYTKAHPDSEVFRSVSIDTEDPLGSVADELRRQAEPPELLEVRVKVEQGEVPLGLFADLLRRSHIEASIKRGAGLVYSHSPAQVEMAISSINAAYGGGVVIDGTAAVALTLLDASVVDDLWGSFLVVETTEEVFREALSA